MSIEWLRLGGALRLEHRHGDGSWSALEPRAREHSVADHDPERGWSRRQVFVCTSCGEEVVVSAPDVSEGEANG